MKIRTKLLLLLLQLGFASGLMSCVDEVGASELRQTEGDKPNILLILADDLGFSDVGAYGSEVATPYLDRLAQQGQRFTQFRNAAKCFPTRASLLTGQYQHDVGMAMEPPGYLQNAVTLAELLKTVGYKTLMVGKHHGLDNPHDRGFDHYYGLREGASNHFNPGIQRAGQPMPAQKDYPPFDGKRVFCFDSKCMKPYNPSEDDYYSTDTFTDWALELLSGHEQAADGQPFFMYLSYTAPHDPIQAWPKDIAKYEGKYDAGYEAVAQARYERQIASGLIQAERYPRSAPTHQAWVGLGNTERRDQVRLMEVYSAMIDNLDQNIGRVINHLAESGELDNTLIMFLSDNGASAEVVDFGDGEIGNVDRWSSIGEHWANVANVPFRGFKNTSFEGGVVTPFIVRWPGVVPEGGRVNETSAHVVDFMPTFVDITGAKYPTHHGGVAVGPMDGESLLEAFKGKRLLRSAPLFFEWSRGQAVVDGQWKLVRWQIPTEENLSNLSPGNWQMKKISTGEWELFDLSKDRTETNDLSGSHAGKATELIAKYASWRALANSR